jgi:hypothetical protein
MTRSGAAEETNQRTHLACTLSRKCPTRRNASSETAAGPCDADRGSPPDLGHPSSLLDERKDDGDRAKGTVGSSSDPLVHLLDVRRVSTDDLDLFSPALAGLRDGLSRPCPLLDELREDRDESSHYRKKYRDDVEDASHYLKDSLHYLKEASHRRFRPKSARKRLLHRLYDDLAHVEGERASRFRLLAVVSRAKSDVKEVLQHRSGAKSSRSKSREHRDCFLQYV